MIEQHPYNNPEDVPADTRVLIVGTAPPPRFSKNSPCPGMRGLDFDFYYGSEDNYMWQFLGEIAEDINYPKKPLFTDDEDAEVCTKTARAFLEASRVWMYDTLNAYQRKTGREHSAHDADIAHKELTDFTPVFQKLSGLNEIAFTSEQASVWTFESLSKNNLISPDQYKVFQKSFSEWKNIRITDLDRTEKIKRKFLRPFLTTAVNKRECKFYLLPSPTGRSRMGLKISDKKDIYKRVIFGR
jgi:G:T/U-mismatch repair DNA glycosylase